MIARLDEIANRLASLDATLVKGNASAPLGAEVSTGSSKWLPPVPSLIEPSSDLRSGSRAELNTNSVREVMDDSAAPSATFAQPTRPEGRSLPVGAESDPILSSPTSRVNQVGLIAQEFNPDILNIQNITAFNQQPYLSDSGPMYTQACIEQSYLGISPSQFELPYLTSSEADSIGQSVDQCIFQFDSLADINWDNVFACFCGNIATDDQLQSVIDAIDQLQQGSLGTVFNQQLHLDGAPTVLRPRHESRKCKRYNPYNQTAITPHKENFTNWFAGYRPEANSGPHQIYGKGESVKRSSYNHQFNQTNQHESMVKSAIAELNQISCMVYPPSPVTSLVLTDAMASATVSLTSDAVHFLNATPQPVSTDDYWNCLNVKVDYLRATPVSLVESSEASNLLMTTSYLSESTGLVPAARTRRSVSALRVSSGSSEAFELYGDEEASRNSGDTGASAAPAHFNRGSGYLDASPSVSGLIEPSSALKDKCRAADDRTPARGVTDGSTALNSSISASMQSNRPEGRSQHGKHDSGPTSAQSKPMCAGTSRPRRGRLKINEHFLELHPDPEGSDSEGGGNEDIEINCTESATGPPAPESDQRAVPESVSELLIQEEEELIRRFSRRAGRRADSASIRIGSDNWRRAHLCTCTS